MRTLAVKEPSHTQRRQAEVNRAVVQPSHRSLSSGVLQRKSSCACGGGCPRCQEQALLQTKLKISEPGDRYEQEADRIADRVMQMPEPSVQRQMEPEEDEEKGMVQRKAIANQVAPLDSHQEFPGVPSIVHEVINSSGQPLSPETRSFMESRFGRDFHQVRIHTDGCAAESAKAVGALAYTVGQRIVFGAGQYAPQTSTGRRLLAHELTHTVQQHNSQLRRKRSRTKISEPIVSTDTEQARRKGRELAELIKTGKWKPENDEQLRSLLEFFEGFAWFFFVSELNEVLGEKFTEFEGKSKKHPEGIYAAVTKTSLVIPTSKPEIVPGGFQVAFFAQITDETSDSTSVEVYYDLSTSGGLGIEIPVKKIAKFKLGGEAKVGRKKTESKEEKKKTSRTGRTISRTFTIQKVERKVFKYDYLKTYYGVSADPESSILTPLPAPQFPTSVTRESREFSPSHIQVGYQIVLGKEAGDKLLEPFWNIYKDYLPVDGSALAQVWTVLNAERRKIAEDLVFSEG